MRRRWSRGGGVVRRHAVAPVEAADAGPDPAPARVRAGDPADHRGMGRRDRVPHRCGHITDDRRQEFILLSDVLGVSMQTIAVNNEAHGNATEATVFGPFFVEGSPEIPIGGDIAGGAAGEPCWVEGTVTGHRRQAGRRAPGSRSGRPTRTASTTSSTATTARRPRAPVQRRPRPLRVLGDHADAVPDPARRPGRRAARRHRPVADARGAPALHGVRRRPAHAGDAHLRPGRRVPRPRRRVRGQALPGQGLQRQDAGTPTPDGRAIDGPWSRARFDIVLAPARGTKDEDVHWIAVHEGHRLT